MRRAKQATRWPGATLASGGTSRRQMSIASGQRGWKRQPGGGSARLGGAPFEALLGRGVADARQAGDQVRGVGMARRAEDVGGAALLDQPAGIHDAEPVGEVGVHRHVVGDEEHRRADLALHLADHRQHVLLHHDVERGGRLVGDDEFGPADGGERDGDALAHAAGELVRIGVEHVGLEMQARAGGARTMSRNSGIGWPMWRKAKSTKEWRTRRTGFSTFIEPCMM